MAIGIVRLWKWLALLMSLCFTTVIVISVLAEQMHVEERAGPEQITFGPVGETEPAISPDRRWIAYQYFTERNPRLPAIGVLETLKGFQSAKALVDHDYAAEVSWSPDSEWLSFVSSENKGGRNTEQICKVNITTKEIVQLSAFAEGTLVGDSTAWSSKGIIAFERDGRIYGVSGQGGEVIELLDTRRALSNRRPSSLRFSHDGKVLLFSVEGPAQNQSEIWAADLPSQSFRQLTKYHFDLFPSWYDEHRLVFSREAKNGTSSLYISDLRRGGVERVTFGHVDFGSSADASSRTLFFSRKDRTSSENDKGAFFSGFHIWRMTIPSRLVR